MITDAFLDVLQVLAETILGLIPVPSSIDTTGWPAAAAEISSRGAWASHWIPIGPGAAAAGICVAWWLTCWSVITVIDLGRKIRLIG